MNELNKKLAEWVPLEHNPDTANRRITWIKNPDTGQWHPNWLTQSLDACFRWLAPKLDKVKIILNEAPSGDIFWNASANSKTVTAETPALALCLAIEKLIDANS